MIEISEVVRGSGVPTGASTRKLLTVLAEGHTEVFASWLRGEIYRQQRRINKLSKKDALALAMTPEIAKATCSVEYI
jgi:hypothetical protein